MRIVWEELKWDARHSLKAPPPSSYSKASLSKASLLFTKPADNTFIPFYSRRSWTEWGTVEHCAAAVWTGPNLVSERKKVISIALHFRVWSSNYYRGIRISL